MCGVGGGAGESEQVAQQSCGLVPQRAGAPLVALAVQAHQWVRTEVEVLDA